MIKVSVLYPNGDGSSFDHAYYLERHIPMVTGLLGDACRSAAVERGLAGAAPGSPPAFAAMGHLVFDSVEAFEAAFAPHAETILGDIPNYTNVTPTLQISQIEI